MNIIQYKLFYRFEFEYERQIMEYLTSVEMSEKWNITSRRISVLCSQGRIEGVIKKGKTWLIPSDAEKPADARVKSGKYKNDFKEK